MNLSIYSLFAPKEISNISSLLVTVVLHAGVQRSLSFSSWHGPLTFAAQLLEKKRMIMVTGKITLRPAPVSILTISVCFYYWRTLKKLRGAGANIILAYAAYVSSREASPLSATKPVVGRRSTLGLWPGSCKIF